MPTTMMPESPGPVQPPAHRPHEHEWLTHSLSRHRSFYCATCGEDYDGEGEPAEYAYVCASCGHVAPEEIYEAEGLDSNRCGGRIGDEELREREAERQADYFTTGDRDEDGF